MGQNVFKAFSLNHKWFAFMAILTIYYVRRYRQRMKERRNALKGKTVVVNGVQSGIGYYIALECGARGAIVIVVDCSESAAASCANIIDARNGRAFYFSCDTSNEKAVHDGLIVPLRKLQEEKHIGPVEALIDVNVRPPLDAKIAPPVYLLRTDAIRKEFEVAAIGHFIMIRAFINDMIDSNRGTLAVISSSAALTGVANQVHFCANQFAARGLMEAMRVELREYGLTGINVFWGCIHLKYIDPVDISAEMSTKLLCPTTELQAAAYDVIEGICAQKSVLFCPRYLGYISILRSLLAPRMFHRICSLLNLSGGHNYLTTLF